MTCPICDRPADRAYTPFCSRRCADVDLGRWLTGGYAVPASEEEPHEDATADRADDRDHGSARTRNG